jgi:putative phosphoribosyl transferase
MRGIRVVGHPAFFSDRHEAGERLAEGLAEYRGRGDVVVIGVPRGGVVVAAEVSKALDVLLDVVIVKKLGYPGNPEFALGATGPDSHYINREIASHIPRDYIDKEIEAKQREARERVKMLRGVAPPIDLQGKTVIVVDDGVATGSSMIMAVELLRANRPAAIIVAVPVAPPEAVKALSLVADRVVAVSKPENFYAIGQFYGDFSQTSDEEVRHLLEEARERRESR